MILFPELFITESLTVFFRYDKSESVMFYGTPLLDSIIRVPLESKH
jgi:hypothetical protein